ncbi:MAG: NAD-dependent protein deacylase [Alphaproteobacteria bacterium]|nr:NAD-dependent protein deacylase [Alphaproteobacteria bacterium]
MSQNVVILTGAGISAESGLKTFRDSGGLWENHRVEDVATPQGFERNPKLVQRFYNLRRQQLNEVEPNLAHAALAEMEKRWKGNFLLVTQNVDNLHEVAGNRHILHMHGELQKVSCQRSLEIFTWKEDVTAETLCPCCKLPHTLRPYIVWFGEIPLYMDIIGQALMECDVFIAIGTSGQVYPAAGFVQEAKYHGATTIECNMEPSHNPAFDHGVYGRATERVMALSKHHSKK